MTKILIITHGELGMEIVRTAEAIVGKQQDTIVLSVTNEYSLSHMCQRVADVLQGIDSKEGTLILSDMLGGTPCNACLPFSTTHKIEIITGLNLYMLISAFINRPNLALGELAVKVMNDGRKSIANAKEIFVNKLK